MFTQGGANGCCQLLGGHFRFCYYSTEPKFKRGGGGGGTKQIQIQGVPTNPGGAKAPPCPPEINPGVASGTVHKRYITEVKLFTYVIRSYCVEV